MRRQAQAGTDSLSGAVRLVWPNLISGVLAKSDAFEKGKPTRFVFLLTGVVWSIRDNG